MPENITTPENQESPTDRLYSCLIKKLLNEGKYGDAHYVDVLQTGEINADVTDYFSFVVDDDPYNEDRKKSLLQQGKACLSIRVRTTKDSNSKGGYVIARPSDLLKHDAMVRPMFEDAGCGDANDIRILRSSSDRDVEQVEDIAGDPILSQILNNIN